MRESDIAAQFRPGASARRFRKSQCDRHGASARRFTKLRGSMDQTTDITVCKELAKHGIAWFTVIFSF